jgi:DNA-binding response OmpR family regulator
MSEDATRLALVADDDPDILFLVSTRVEQLGFEVVTAPDGEEALELLRARTPDLCVLDVRMPRLDGHQVVRALREDPATAGIPVLLLSAGAEQASVTRGLEAGADGYLRKPFKPDELRAAVDKVIDARG